MPPGNMSWSMGMHAYCLVADHTLIFSGSHLGLACTCTLYIHVLSCERLSTVGWWSSHKKCGHHLWDDAYVL